MISVCIATYNGEEYVLRQLESILEQLSEEDEIIISDNGSTDDTLAIIHNCLDRRIKVYSFIPFDINYKYSKKHYLVTRNFENALKYAKGDYIFLADQDDIWKENKVKIMIEYLKYYDLVMSNYDVIDKNDTITSYSYLSNKNFSKCFFLNLIRMPFWGCCMAFKKEILKRAYPFPHNLIMHDNWIGFIAILTGKFKFVDIPLINYRRHDTNVSQQKGSSVNPFCFKLYYRISFFYMLINRLFTINK